MSSTSHKYSLEYMELVRKALQGERMAGNAGKVQCNEATNFADNRFANNTSKQAKVSCRQHILAKRRARKRKIDLVYARERRSREKSVEIELQKQFSTLYQTNTKLAEENMRLEKQITEAQYNVEVLEESKRTEKYLTCPLTSSSNTPPMEFNGCTKIISSPPSFIHTKVQATGRKSLEMDIWKPLNDNFKLSVDSNLITTETRRVQVVSNLNGQEQVSNKFRTSMNLSVITSCYLEERLQRNFIGFPNFMEIISPSSYDIK